MKPPWSFDEFWIFDPTRNGGPDFSSPEQVEAYDRKQHSDPAQERKLLRELGLGADHTLIEFGSGTGTLVLEAAKICKEVIAVDISKAMLEHARKRAESLGLDNLSYRHEGFLSYEHRGEPVDFAITKNALHHLPDFWKVQALHQISELLKPGGTFYLRDVVYSFEPVELAERIEAWFDAVTVANPEEGWTRAEFEAHVRGEFSTYSWVLEAMFQKTGFEIVGSSYGDLKTYASYTCVKA